MTSTKFESKPLFTRQQLTALLLPLIAEQALSVTIGLADTLMVSSVGEAAVSGVSLVDTFNTLMIQIMTALATGGAVVASQYIGHREEKNARAAAAQILFIMSSFSVLVAAVVVVGRHAILRGIFGAIDADVMRYAETYFLLSALSYPFIGLYNAGAALFRAQGNSKISMMSSLVMNVVNIGGNAILIFGFKMGVMGAALATGLSQVACAALTLRCFVGSQWMPWHIRAEKLRLHGDVFAAICTIGVPAAAQSAMYNISNMFIQSSMNSFGTSTIAAWGVYGKIDILFWMTINSLGIAITTFAGQNFGARQYDRVRRGVRVCLAMAACTPLVISFTFYNLAEVLFRLFSQDDAVVAVGVGMMHVLTPVYITYVCIEVLAGALRGCGDVRVPTLITVFFVCGLRMLWLFIAVPIRHEVATVEMSYPITWSLASALFILYYVKGGWMQRCAEKWEKKQAG